MWILPILSRKFKLVETKFGSYEKSDDIVSINDARDTYSNTLFNLPRKVTFAHFIWLLTPKLKADPKCNRILGSATQSSPDVSKAVSFALHDSWQSRILKNSSDFLVRILNSRDTMINVFLHHHKNIVKMKNSTVFAICTNLSQYNGRKIRLCCLGKSSIFFSRKMDCYYSVSEFDDSNQFWPHVWNGRVEDDFHRNAKSSSIPRLEKLLDSTNSTDSHAVYHQNHILLSTR